MPAQILMRSTVSAQTDRRTQRRQAIIAAATQLFAECGFAGCEMDRLATELNVAKGTLYL